MLNLSDVKDFKFGLIMGDPLFRFVAQCPNLHFEICWTLEFEQNKLTNMATGLAVRKSA